MPSPLKKIGFVSLFFLTACASHMSRQDCLNTQWHTLGFSDAIKAKLPRNLEKSVQDCARFKLTIDTKGYQRGWRAGARKLCASPESAKRLGAQGWVYNGMCPSALEPDFLDAWHLGIRLYCTPQTAYRLGLGGQKYPGFCPADLEVSFHNAYDRGRTYHAQIHSLQNELERNARKKRWVQHKIDSRKDALYADTQNAITAPLKEARKEALHQATAEGLVLTDLRQEMRRLMQERHFLLSQLNQVRAEANRQSEQY